MQTRLLSRSALGAGALLLAGLPLVAQGADPRNRFSLNARCALNIRADFQDLGDFPAQSDPDQGIYDDGFNRVDISGNAGGTTWFWGYENAAQYQDDAIFMHSSSSAADGLDSADTDDPHYGFELAYARELGRWGQTRFGLEAAFGYTDINIRNNTTVSSDVLQITDAYALNGVIPPLAPYSGSFEGPGPLLSDAPARTTATIPGGALTTGSRTVEAQLFGFRLGPYLELPLFKPVSLGIGGGLALAYLDSQFAYRETTTIPRAGSFSSSASSSDHDFLVGGYAEARIAVTLHPRWAISAGAQFQHLGQFEQETAGKSVELDFRQSIYLTAGMSYGF